MLKSWSIQNFKPILDSGELKLAPVTVLAGRNSSGKSSLIQSILMIAQTLSNRISDQVLLPNGPIVQLGTFEDILSEQTDLRTLTVSFALEMDKAFAKTRVRNYFGINVESVKITSQFRSASSNWGSASAIEASKVYLESVSLDVQTSLLPLLQQDGLYLGGRALLDCSMTIERLSPIELGEFLKDVSSNYLSLVPYTNKELNYLGKFTLKSKPIPRESLLEPCLIAFSHFLPIRFIEKHSESGTKALDDADYTIYWQCLDEAIEQITQFFTSEIRYLGPLRADPQAAQKFAPSSERDDVGAKGEYAAAVYHANQSTIIQWYNPSTEVTEESTLNIALNTWIRYLGVANEVKTQEAGLSGVSWQVVHKAGRKALPLSAVGGGVSQILPILVMGLLAPNNTLLIVEEPELGLHPSVQARLGDFFMGLAKCSKQCLIEAHSENLVSQLRLHIVEAGGQENADCLIYFVDQNEQGAAQFNPIEISPKGNILNWPDGFFDETMLQEDRITAAGLKKRAKKANDG